jgi:Ca2+-binding EF-hand superfamily protein
MAIRHFDDLKLYYKQLFQEFDTDQTGALNLDQFNSLIQTLDKNIKSWKILAMFQNITGKEKDFEGSTVRFSEFLTCATTNDLMDGLIEGNTNS